MLQSQPQLKSQSLQNNKHLIENNKRAYELLLRIQSQIEASTVIAVATKRGTDYE